MPRSSELRLGIAGAAGAYGLWGFLPLYFKLMGDTPPFVILAHRILWSVPTVLLAILIVGRAADLWDLRKRPRLLLGLAVSAIAVGANWAIYIWAVTNGRILEGSLGYFINPLLTFLLAALFFKERFGLLQLGALGLGAAGVANQALVVGEFPWVALGLAMTFAGYGALRKVLPVDARSGLMVETLWLSPFALAFLLSPYLGPAPVFGVSSPTHLALLALAGPVTATPLILFAIGARRLNMSTLAMLQYLGPTLQFIIGLAYGEKFTSSHAITFVLIWSGVGLFTLSAFLKERKMRTDAAAA